MLYAIGTSESSTTKQTPTDSVVASESNSSLPRDEAQPSPVNGNPMQEQAGDTVKATEEDQLVLSTDVSFDCMASNLTETERVICSTEVLRIADGEMTGLYKQALAEGRTSIEDQRIWLMMREACSVSSENLVACMQDKYAQRISELKKPEQ